ncbi:MAG: xanthine dehydrogenase family protein molybdopterin-binding subunit [Sphingomonadales bacterium]|nr:xanthine dehydrogenase family protein molybdopterin-binding subunit [Sphingomonadales bacterium]MBK6721098.1 xanthine dehydrogenase family protein molybdopterin-binding subunit [Sphingomonadales bacterium]MBK8272619.1 xanthine dehydrogenase family protein molybdopterin-binding subunit [Sphingomonadales bacterium]MBK8861975.1 xanthine dehydrogenase family protein molybdopterin-binding subunit [Sphingomonadales bacterium]MBL0116332.1 xanthine dehydrogenase family protein molybdopterin-binding 
MEFSRRSLLAGAAIGGGLAIGWALWPRAYPPNLVAAEGERIFNAWLKIGTDGHVTVVVPQVEMGQGSYTVIPQIIADELGADWRTIAVEPAPLSPAYANTVFADEWHEGWWPKEKVQATGGSSTVRGYEFVARQAGAAARALLCKAAAKRWDADWLACDTEGGFVTRGDDRLRFGELVEDAARMSLPKDIPLRTGNGVDRLSGRGMNRLDIPAKLDGSANFAADIRLPDMVYASIRQGPLGDSILKSVDKAAADRIFGVLEIVEHERWVAAIATNWWAANRALDAMHPRFFNRDSFSGDRSIDRALVNALGVEGTRVAEAGDVDAALENARVSTAEYSVGLAPHAAIEPLSATATLVDGRLQLWIATQLPGLARDAAARAIGIDPEDVTIHPMLVGGSFGRKYEVEIAGQVAILALKIKRPVQLTWSRAEDLMHEPFRPAARARMTARLGRAGHIDAWLAQIAAPNGLGEMRSRTMGGHSADAARRHHAGKAHLHAVEGAAPSYTIENFGINHHPADIGVPTGPWRGRAHSYTAFFNECFIDELSRESGVEPFSFRMAMLGGNPRLALCLSKVATKGGWEGGGQGTGQGLACHAMAGSQIAVLAEAQLDDSQRIRVTRLVAVADIGRVINPDIARQQIEGGLLFGMAAATGNAVHITRGVAGPLRLRELGLPKLGDMPEISVELVASNAAPGGAGELGVPAVAPAIANAIFAGSGRRIRNLPLSPANF